VISNNLSNRLKILKENLRLNHLNKEETLSILFIIEDYNDIFHLPRDKLKGTNIIAHFIPTITFPYILNNIDIPLFTRRKLNNKLLEQVLIEPFLSPFNSPLWPVPKKPDANNNK